MTREQGSKYEDTAIAARDAGELERAGEYYTRAAFEYLGANGLVPKPFASKSLMYLLLAATCYRADGQIAKVKFRCQQGSSLAEDLSDQALTGQPPSYDYDAAERGVWAEFAGDFQVVGGFSAPVDAYEEAKQIYRDAGDPRIGLAEQIPMAAIAYFRRVMLAADGDIDEFSRNERTLSFTEWLDFKIETLPVYLETITDSHAFDWEPPETE